MSKIERRFVSCIFVAMTLLVSPPVRGQEATATPPKDPPPTIQMLEDQIKSLQEQLAALKKQVGTGTVSASSKPSASGASSAAGEASVPASPPVTPAAAPAPAPAANAFDSIAINGFVDGYYSYDLQHPHTAATSVLAGTPAAPGLTVGTSSSELAGLRAFDAPQEALSLNMVELILNKAPTEHTSPLGFDLAFGYGNAMNVVNSTEPGSLGFAQYLKEAYLSYDAPLGKGLEIDFGKFVTQHGQEVIETNANWNYSRSILFTYAIPFYHYGLRAKYAWNDKYNATVYLVNGWNNIVDNNTGKTVGLQLAWAPSKKLSWTNNYMFGPEMTGTNSHWRQMYDTEATYSPTGKLSLAWNFDYGRGDEPAGFTNPVWWSGAAGYIRYAFTDSYAFAGRYEFYDDHNGFTTGGPPQDINEFTLTFERLVAKNLLTRWEFRRDMSNQASLYRGSTPTKNQNTFTGGLVYTFDIHDAH